jgi:hypothetical protein
MKVVGEADQANFHVLLSRHGRAEMEVERQCKYRQIFFGGLSV